MVGDGQVRLGTLFHNRREHGRPGLPLMSVTMNDGLVERKSLDRKTDSELCPDQHLLLRPGDLAYNMMRMWQGASGVARHEGIVSPAYVVLEPAESVDSLFASYWFKSARMLYRFWAYSYGLTGDRLRLYYKDFASIPALLPPLKHQKRAAALLSACDAMIAYLSQLESQMRALKRGLMQQLLTGRTRFSSFGPAAIDRRIPSDWTRLALGEVADVIFSNVDKHASPGEVPVRLCNYLDVYKNEFLTDRLAYMPATAAPNEIRKFALQEGDIVITKDSEIASDIAKPALVVEPLTNVVCGYHLGILRPMPRVSCTFLAQMLMFSPIRHEFSRVANGVTRFGLTLRDVKRIPVWLPSLPEQIAIGDALNTASHELAFLRRMVNRTKKLKRGLMQRLLTDQARGPTAKGVRV